MPSVAPYIPVRDVDLNNWLANFSTLISASPSTYGLLASDGVTIASEVAAWVLAYTPCTSPATKTATAVGIKNTAKVTVVSQIRVYAQVIAKNPGVTSGNKIALGLNPGTSFPSPITPPASNPVLVVQSAGHLSIILRYRDSAASPSVKAKPYGVIGAQIFGGPSATPITVPVPSPLLTIATKSPVTITFPGGSGGMQGYFWARWAITTGGVSPWSPIINFTIPAAG
jgi:hypothetical protein